MSSPFSDELSSPDLSGVSNYIQSRMGFANQAPWAAYSQMPGIPPSMNPGQMGQMGGQYNPVWGSQGQQTMFGGGGPMGQAIQSIIMSQVTPMISRMTGISENTIRGIPWQGMGNLGAYDYGRAAQMGRMEFDMVKGTGDFAGRPIAAQNNGSNWTSNGMMGSMLRDFIGSDMISAARIGMREMVPNMPGTLKSRANSVYNVVTGLAESGSGGGGFFDGTSTSGIGMADTMEAIGMASRFGIQGFTAGELNRGFGDSGRGSRSRNAAFAGAQNMAEVVAAGRGIMGKNTSVGQVLGMVTDVFGEGGVSSAGDAARRLRSVQSMSEVANVDAKFMAEYVKVMRKMGENMGMSGQTAANFAIKSTEAAVQTQAAAGRNGVAMTLSEAGRIAGAGAEASANSGGAQGLDALRYGILANTSEAQRRGIKIKGVGTLEDVERLYKDVAGFNSADPASMVRSRNALAKLRANQSNITNSLTPAQRAAIMADSGAFMNSSAEDRDFLFQTMGSKSINPAFASGLNPLMDEALSKGKILNTRDRLSPLATALAGYKGKGGFEGALNQFFNSEEGRTYTRRTGLSERNNAAILRDINQMTRGFSNKSLGLRSIMAEGMLAGRPEIAAEQATSELSRILVEGAAGSSAIGLLSSGGLETALKTIAKSPGLDKLAAKLTEAGVLKDGKIDAAELEKWKTSEGGKSTWSKLVGGLAAGADGALSKVLGLPAGELLDKISRGEKIGTWKGERYSAQKFGEMLSKEGDAEAKEKMIRDFTKSTIAENKGTPQMQDAAKEAIENMIKEQTSGSEPTDPNDKGGLLKGLKEVFGEVGGPIKDILTILQEWNAKKNDKPGTPDPKTTGGSHDSGD